MIAIYIIKITNVYLKIKNIENWTISFGNYFSLIILYSK